MVPSEALQVPLNRAIFRKFRNTGVALVGMGLFATLLLVANAVEVFANPKMREIATSSVFVSALVALILGLVLIPVCQLVFSQTQTLNQHLPALVVDQEGIQDNASDYVFGRISWQDIASINVANRYDSNADSKFLGIAIVVCDKNILLRKKSRMLAIGMTQDAHIVERHIIFIPQSRLDTPIEDVARLANEYRQRCRTTSW